MRAWFAKAGAAQGDRADLEFPVHQMIERNAASYEVTAREFCFELDLIIAL